ncbi:MAG: MIP family channel protein [Thermoflexales bacterium]|nr:MIP family channel protein [Thermoflexales bacterium]
MKRGNLLGELLAEALGTFVLVLLTDGVVANVGLAPRLPASAYNWNTVAFGCAMAVVAAVYIAGGVSGAHINPAVTLAFAVRGKFPWQKVLPYWAAQIVGAFLGAFGVYLAYMEGLRSAGMPNVWSTGPGSVFGQAFWGSGSTQAVASYSIVNAFTAEVIGTAVLLMGIIAITDTRNLGAGANLGPFMIGMLVLSIGLSLGGPSGFAINPARDFGPRLFGAIAGTPRLFEDLYWLVAPILGPLIGGVIGTFVYDTVIGRSLEQK